MVMYDVLWNFMTGKYEEAAQRGVAWMGLTGAYSWVDTRAEQLITHGVVRRMTPCNAPTVITVVGRWILLHSAIR
jgi:hypothetical protein